jgi:hypothetical protein
MKSARTTGERIEFVTAVLLTLWTVVLHLLFLSHAGPLWRDESGTIDFASMPTLADIWHNLQYDNFPPLFVAVTRIWTLAGLHSDFNYRVLGFLIGMGTLAVLWYSSRQLSGKAPLLVLALYAINPLSVTVGDSMRPYGLGVVLNLLTLALYWKFMQSPGRKTFLWAAVGAVLSVQCLYQNAFFIFAFTIGAWVVTVAQKKWKVAGQVGLISLLAALSLLPHVGNVLKGRDWGEITASVVHLADVGTAFFIGLEASAPWITPVWLALGLAALVVATLDGVKNRRWNMLYTATAMVVAAVLYFAFIWRLGMRPRSWYFLLFMAPSALIIDSILAGLNLGRMVWARAIPSAIIALACFPACVKAVQVRESNVDLIATQLKTAAQPGDMILVSPWYYGVAVQRYLDTNRFVTLPPMDDIRIHRYDLMKKSMQADDPIGPLMEKIKATLRAGHSLFVVGTFVTPPAGQPAEPLYPPYHGGLDMADARYFSNWLFYITAQIQQHATAWAWVPVPIPNGQRVNTFENLTVLVVHGWRE